MIIIGSHALAFRLSLTKRVCRDYDFICNYHEFDRWVKSRDDLKVCYPIDDAKKMIVKTSSEIYEFEMAWEWSTAQAFLELVENDPETKKAHWIKPNVTAKIPSLNALYTLKMSHRFLKNSPHFKKTMSDINLMKQNGAKISDYYKDWYKERQKATYTYNHPKLNQNKADFFDLNQGVTYHFDHDSIHVAMAHLDKPAYEFYKSADAEVMCDKKAFFNGPEEVRLYGVLEEAYVLALERSQIPFKGKVDPKRSFDIALEKVCTSITSGWFRAYAYDNYDKVKSLYDPEYVTRFWKAVELGIVKNA
jgi:hypothetical protein